MIQPLPYHRILGQSRRQQIATLMRHMDPSGSGEVAAPWARLAIELINPMYERCSSLWPGGGGTETRVAVKALKLNDSCCCDGWIALCSLSMSTSLIK